MALTDDTEALEAQLFDETNIGPNPTTQEIRVVKPGDTLMGISQETGVPLERLARDNNIKDVNLIQPGQEIRFTKPAEINVETDISAEPESAGIDVNDLTIEGETTTAVDAATGGSTPGVRPFTTPESREAIDSSRRQNLQLRDRDFEDISDVGTATDVVGENVLDFEAEAATGQLVGGPEVEEASIDGPPVTEKVIEEPGGPVDTMPVNYEQKREVVEATLPEDSKSVFKQSIDEIDKLGIKPDSEDFYEKIADTINKNIDAYNTKISDIAEEKQKPTFEGWNKFLAVLGASMGAYGSAMTGTPNFALNIMNDAIDRDAQAFLKSKEVRTKSLENQRMDLIMRRGELLQMAQNRTSQLMQAETFKLAKAEAKANITNLDKQLLEKIAKNKQDYQLVTSRQIIDLYINDVNLRNTLNKEQRKKMVNSFTATDSKGEVKVVTAYVARDVDSAKKISSDQTDALKVLDLLDQINELHKSPTVFIPAWMGGSDKSELNTKTAELELLLKDRMGMGANYSEYEQARIKAIAPGTDLTDMLYQHKIKSDALRDEVIAKVERDKIVQSFGEVGNTSQADQILRASQTNISKFGGKKVRN